MASFMITDLPLELHISISEYLLPFEIRFLSQSCVSLRNIYHPLLYSQCVLVKKNKIADVFIHQWPVPDLVLYHPTRYSWFPYKNVKAIHFDKTSGMNEIIDMLPVDKYTSLRKVSSSSFSYNGLFLSCYDGEIPRENELKFKDISFMRTNDLLPVIKRQEHLFEVKTALSGLGDAYDCFMKVFNCSKIAERKGITSLKIAMNHFQGPFNRYNFYKELLEIDCFPNLKELHWVVNDNLSKTIVEKVVSSLPRCSALEKLKIAYLCMNNRHLYLLDDLRGSWKSFFFNIGFFQEFMSRLSHRLRLSSVTHLKLNGREPEIPNIEYGTKITSLMATIKQRPHPQVAINPFASEKVQNMLYNIRTLMVTVSRVDFASDHLIFRSVLPNLKALHLNCTDGNFQSRLPYVFLNDFQFMLEVAPFGDFDMLNVDHMEKLVNRLQKRCKRMKSFDVSTGVQELDELKKSILTAVQNSDFLETSRLFYALQFISFFGFQNIIKRELYANANGYISFTLYSVKQYLPNIEVLRIDNPMFLELYPMLFHVLKCQKSLKQFYSLHGLTELVDSDDKLYKRFCNCMYLDPVSRAFLQGDMKAFHSSDVDLEDKFVPLTEKLRIEHDDYSIRFKPNSIHSVDSWNHEYFQF